MDKNKILSRSIIILTLGIVLSSIWLGYSIQKSSDSKIQATNINSDILNLSQAASYLGMSQEEVEGIIKTEKDALDQNGGFTGVMFPYFIVNGKQYFYKEQIDEWLKDVTTSHREYDTRKGIMY